MDILFKKVSDFFFFCVYFKVFRNYKVPEMNLTQHLLLWTWFAFVGQTSRMIWRICLGFGKSSGEKLLRNAAFFKGAEKCRRFRDHCPLNFLDMRMAEVYVTLSFSDSPLSSFHRSLRSHLRKLHVPSWFWLWEVRSS